MSIQVKRKNGVINTFASKMESKPWGYILFTIHMTAIVIILHVITIKNKMNHTVKSLHSELKIAPLILL